MRRGEEQQTGSGTSGTPYGTDGAGRPAPDAETLRRLITERVARWTGEPADGVPGDRPLVDFGMSSRNAVALAGELSRATGRALPATLLWETPTVDALVARLAGRVRPSPLTPHADPRGPSQPSQPPPDSAPPEGPIAVVGVGCRLPGGVYGPDDYWRLLDGGVDAVRQIPDDRWWDFTDDPPADINPWGGYLDGIDRFDADFFRISPREAAAMDPQQRLLLEVTQEALDHAAIPAASLAGTRTGVYVGISAHDYGQFTGADPAAVDPWAATGAASGVAPGRISYAFDLRGPSVAVDTACSSSLVAVHQACTALRTGECGTALAAGVNLLLSPAVTVAFGRAGALAPDGRCKAFSSDADGIGRAEGCAVVVLRPLAEALRAGNRVLALIRGTSVNSDGRSNGLMAPNPAAQRDVLTTAYARAGVDPATVDHVEAHGTGTPLGDPIEAGALADVLGPGRDLDQPLLLGSAKSNLGHLEAAAGTAGLVKTVLALHHDTIPASLHCGRSALDDARLRVVTEPEPWPRYGGTAVAGVSAFGFGGTNAHAVLEEWRPARRTPPAAGRASRQPGAPLLLPLSDADPARVRDTAGQLARWLETVPGQATPLADLGRTLTGRTGRGPARAAVVARDREECATALAALAAGRPDPRVLTGDRDLIGPGPVWVFSGYGTQWAGMARELLTTEPAFAEAVEELEPALADACGISLPELLLRGTESDLQRLTTAQPLLYATQVALARLWRAHGVEPAAVIGHSVGEVAAAVVAGLLDPADGARVVAVRSRLLGTLRGGAMAVTDLTDEESDRVTTSFPGVHLAVHSSPRQKLMTGDREAVDRLAAHLSGQGRMARVMPVSGAGHSPHVDPLLPEMTAELAGLHIPDDPVGCSAPVRTYSTVHDDPRAVVRPDAEHWAANLRRPVRLAQALQAARADGHTAFVEVSPHPALLHPLAETLPDVHVQPTLRRGTDAAHSFRSALASLHVAGQPLPAHTLYPDGEVADLPLAAWRHTRHWWNDPRDASTRTAPPATTTTGCGVAPALPDTARLAEAPGDGTPADVPPPVVARLIHHIATVSGHSPQQITPGTRPVDLGLDSLMATRIRAVVELEYGVAPSLRELLTAPSLQALADAVTAGSASPPAPWPQRVDRSSRADHPPSAPLSPLRVEGDRPPLFLAHAAGGTPDVYRQLVRLLGPDQPVYGLERVETADSVRAKAKEYAAAVREVCPRGPYRLGGWSFGGFVAQETACLLSEEGADVDAVVLIDSVRPLPRPGRSAWDVARSYFEGFTAHVARVYGVTLDLPYAELAALDDPARIDRVLRALRDATDLPAAALRHQRDSYLDLRIGEAHTPRRHDGRVILYRATDPAPHTVRDPAYERRDAALGWDEVCPDLEVVRVPGHHLSLLDPPHADVIAAHLTQALAPQRTRE
ncbi:beta-ketoacyl synthase N-terminal-like domain-containing protein [Streptomyces sp. 549]|uniref:beta-ketoacyl synthase N-terminal-like domain-containing protein n=1 Tax=Streptomyces sp. 549 TaxID=3049076 RepID=UPI0024C45648|nr:beta-ketoacyl synthase N-terminal-like domain-containing protein [Streptomyces sp. 549]MDK1474721.1 beta-ketoacyl synthase N-terminal-like domain-containing protein [Streptomyces sp. 549]